MNNAVVLDKCIHFGIGWKIFIGLFVANGATDNSIGESKWISRVHVHTNVRRAKSFEARNDLVGLFVKGVHDREGTI